MCLILYKIFNIYLFHIPVRLVLSRLNKDHIASTQQQVGDRDIFVCSSSHGYVYDTAQEGLE